MSDDFDPYAEWLKIAPHEHPVDHYRLLGVRRFESDAEVISSAADQRMAHVRTFQTGPRAGCTQALLNELSAARICLLNPAAKMAYDQMLEGTLSATSEPPLETAPPICEPPVARSPVEPPRPHSAVASKAAGLPSALAWCAVLALGLGITVGGGLWIAGWWLSGHDANQQPPAAASPPAARPLATAAPPEEVAVLEQQPDGGIALPLQAAQLHGPSLRRALQENVPVLTDWNSMDDWVSWEFRVTQLPRQGIFRVRLQYVAETAADGGSFVVAVGDSQRVCEIRGSGQAVTDEYYLAVPRTGKHTLEIRPRSKPTQQLMTLQDVALLPP